MITVFWVLAVFMVINFALYLFDGLRQWYRRKLREALVVRIINSLETVGSHIRFPEYDEPTAYDVETGQEAFEFVEIADDGRERNIFVTYDGYKVTAMPWRNVDKVEMQAEQ